MLDSLRFSAQVESATISLMTDIAFVFNDHLHVINILPLFVEHIIITQVSVMYL